MQMNFPKVITKQFLESLSQKQLKTIADYAQKNKSKARWAKGYTIAQACQSLLDSGCALYLVANTDKIQIKSFARSGFYIKSSTMIVCFYALDQLGYLKGVETNS